jgi:hypothetical protein
MELKVLTKEDMIRLDKKQPWTGVGDRLTAGAPKFSDSWDVRTDTPDTHILEQMNIPMGSGEICRDFRILGAKEINPGKWRLFRALDDGRGLHSERELGTIDGAKEDAIEGLQEHLD